MIFSVKVSTVFLVAASAVIFIFAPQLTTFFRNDSEVTKIGAAALRYQRIAFPFLGWIIMMNMFLQNIRRVIPAADILTFIFSFPLSLPALRELNRSEENGVE